MITVDRAALLAFVYYDTTHVGYLVDKDVEDMIYTLGLQISRSQVHRPKAIICWVTPANSVRCCQLVYELMMIKAGVS